MSQIQSVSIDYVGPNIHRICLRVAGVPVSYNHFLLTTQAPALVYLGNRRYFEPLARAVRGIMPVESLRHLVFSHFEPDECGALAAWLDAAPEATAFVGRHCATSARDAVPEAAASRITGARDGARLSLGNDTLELLETPHVPHQWDACLFYLHKQRALFGSDLATQVGEQPLWREEDFTDEVLKVMDALGYMPYGPHLDAALNRLASLDIDTFFAMHGAGLTTAQWGRLSAALRQRNAAARSECIGNGRG